MPTVQRRPDLESWLYDALRQHLSRKREGIHTSDLIMPRKAYWAEILPRPPTNREVGYFVAGRGHEDIVVGLSGLGQYRKVRGIWEGISHEMDALAVGEDGSEVPAELKTNRRPKVAEPEEVPQEYELALAQLGSYVAAQDGKRTAYLIQFHLLARGLGPDSEPADEDEWIRQSEPKLVAYQIDWSDAEIASIQDWMRLRRDLLVEAKARRDHTILPECPAWACGKEFIRKFDPRCPRCGRVYLVGEEKGDGAKTGVKKKCDDCKDGRSKVDLVRDQEVHFIPTCRWFFDCRPSGNWPQYVGKDIDTAQSNVVQSDKP